MNEKLYALTHGSEDDNANNIEVAESTTLQTKGGTANLWNFLRIYTASPLSSEIVLDAFSDITSLTSKSSMVCLILPLVPGNLVEYTDSPNSESISGITIL